MTKTIILTRPVEESIEIKNSLINFGVSCKILIEPMLEFQSLKINKDNLNSFNFIITSNNAIKSLINNPEQIAKKSKFYVLSQKAASFLKNLGYKNSSISQFSNVNSLINLISIEHNKKKPLTYLRGEHISIDLTNSLRKNNFIVNEAICYKMNINKKFSQEFQNLNGQILLSFFSKRSALIFLDNFQFMQKLNPIIFCLSENIANEFASWNNKFIFENIDEMIKQIKIWAND